MSSINNLLKHYAVQQCGLCFNKSENNDMYHKYPKAYRIGRRRGDCLIVFANNVLLK